ncbi:MAG: D-alanyl-D-alanine carboxypeptidase/D-alanyl-D-alanine-endopeptidase [Bdellovibrionales bacterium RIFOXYC1_FULL_54_43]|nr:MAG: D-alanyl-D-alanine carboxypeptidase/D-alanyl-D-alanine-endopeptidase [Bdellovibrionales bacterium RIFOXYC1_FULL_54_43]OFZ83351.1 MAG: D-alanyl-D-alanine carboxypeptidase/D-alanyl-D-alanine-endopeptidase [Bdellovibrionales bacterium RIFOXYD1_FULL_55_31]
MKATSSLALLLFAFFPGPTSLADVSFLESAEDVEITVPEVLNPFTARGGPNWDQIINGPGSPGGEQGGAILFGVRISGPSPYVRNPTTVFAPASNAKLFTSQAALQILGPDYRIPTRVQWKRVERGRTKEITELTLIGNGDPSWGMIEHGEDLRTRVDQIAAALVDEGVFEIRGEISVIAGDPRWDQLRYPEGWSPEDITACYGALAQAFNMNINCATLVVTASNRAFWAEEGVPIPVELKIREGGWTSLHVSAANQRTSVAKSFVVSGTWAKGSSPRQFVLPVHDTKAWVRNLLLSALKEKGIRFSAAPVSSDSEWHVLEFYSPSTAELLKPFMKLSLNVIGDALFKVMGQREGDPKDDLVAAGQGVLREWVKGIGAVQAASLGIPARPGFFSEQVTLWDGSGVSRSNQVTTQVVMTLLEDSKRRPEFPALWDSLPIAGIDGTLKNRMQGTPAQGVLRAKTGSLRGVYNLSGFVPKTGAGGAIVDFVPFVVLTKTTAENKDVARAAQDRVGAALAEIVNRTELP